MEQEQSYFVSIVPEIDLEERVRLIVELWGEGEALDEERIMEVAGNLYDAKPERVREALISNLRKGSIKGKFYAVSDRQLRHRT
jgi:hypothetical protein